MINHPNREHENTFKNIEFSMGAAKEADGSGGSRARSPMLSRVLPKKGLCFVGCSQAPMGTR